MKLFLFCFFFICSCTPINQSYRYRYYNKALTSETQISKETIIKNEEITPIKLGHTKLNSFINRWKGVPYLFGGMSMSGIDCSAFSQRFYKKVFGKSIERNSVKQYHQGKFVRKTMLKLAEFYIKY